MSRGLDRADVSLMRLHCDWRMEENVLCIANLTLSFSDKIWREGYAVLVLLRIL